MGTKVENLTTDLTALTGRVTTVETEIGEIYKQLAQTSAIIGQCINVFNAELGQLCAMLSAQLRSIVFSPTEYYQGIEAIGVFSFNYNALSVSAADKTGDQKTDRPTTLTQPETSVVPFVKASYHLNPSECGHQHGQGTFLLCGQQCFLHAFGRQERYFCGQRGT